MTSTRGTLIFVLGGVLAAGACRGAVTLTDGAALAVGSGETDGGPLTTPSASPTA